MSETGGDDLQSNGHKKGRLTGPISGFLTAPSAGGPAHLMTAGWFSSEADKDAFHIVATSAFEVFVTPLMGRVFPTSALYTWLVILHADDNYDLFINHGVRVILDVVVQDNVEKSQLALANQIADARRLRFPDVALVPSDRIVYFTSSSGGWRHGFYFDFTQDQPLDIERLEAILADQYLALNYSHMFRVDPTTQKMEGDGWFPFLALAGGDFEMLYTVYADPGTLPSPDIIVLGRWSVEKLRARASNWHVHPVIKAEARFLESALDSYEKADYIAATLTLLPRIESVLRRAYHISSGGRPKVRNLLDQLQAFIDEQDLGIHSLYHPVRFLQYLNDYFNRQCDLDAGQLQWSRNLAMHGVAGADDFTQARCLQVFFILHQLAFYIPRDLETRGEKSDT